MSISATSPHYSCYSILQSLLNNFLFDYPECRMGLIQIFHIKYEVQTSANQEAGKDCIQMGHMIPWQNCTMNTPKITMNRNISAEIILYVMMTKGPNSGEALQNKHNTHSYLTDRYINQGPVREKS